MKRLLACIALSKKGLGFFRKAIALVCLLDAAQRLTQATFLYSDLGVLPRYAYYAYAEDAFDWSFYFLSGRPAFAATLMLVTGALAVAQLMGRTTRARRAALWMLVFSVQGRFPGLLDSADDLLRLCLFWDIFLPDDQPAEPGAVVSLATLGLQLQLSWALAGTAWHYGPSQWLLASQWSSSPQALGWSWLGQVPALAVLAVWWHDSRRFLLPVVGLALLGQALLLDPAFPIALGAALSCLWPFRRESTDAEVIGSLRQPSQARWRLALWTVAVLAGPLWMALPRNRHLAIFEGPAQALGLAQDWSRIYPLAQQYRLQVLLRSAQSSASVFSLDKRQGRRLGLLSADLLRDARLLTPFAQHFAERENQPMTIWVQTERFSGTAAPEERIKRLDTVGPRAPVKGNGPR